MDVVKDLQDLEVLKVEKVEKVKEKPLQKIKVKKGESVTEDAVVIQEEIPKKKERTQKQIETFLKAREKKLANETERKAKRAQEEEEKKKELEQKIVSKAISIKKKEIKQKAILDSISDDETSVEEIKEIAKKIKPKTEIKREIIEPTKPLSVFEKYKFI